MGLDSALSAAASALKVNQESLGVVTQNIANVNNKNYIRRTVNQASSAHGGIGQGVAITSVGRVLDPYLQASIRTQESDVQMTNTLDKYFQRVELVFGDPNAKATLNSNLNSLFSSLKALALTPDASSLRLSSVTAAVELATQISSMATNFDELRYQAEVDINSAVDTINNLLSTLNGLNVEIKKASILSADQSNLLETRDVALTQLAGLLDVSVYERPSGDVVVSTSGGKVLLDSTASKLNYVQNASVYSYINNAYVSDLFITDVNNAGQITNSQDLISAGKGEASGTPTSITDHITSGSLRALQQLRDVELPLMIDQLDNLAYNLRTQFNAVHNSGGGFPPITEMTGTRSVTSTDARTFQGSARIGLVDNNGKPVFMPDGTPINALTLNLAGLSSGGVIGQPTTQTIVDEINEYFYNSPTLTHTAMGNLSDIKLAAYSNLAAAPGGPISFDLQLSNLSQINSSVQVLGVTVTDAGAAGLTSALPGSYNSLAGSRDRTSQPFTVSFAGGAGGPYTVQVQVKITDANNNITSGTLSFPVNDNPGTTKVINSRYVATGVTGSATIVQPNNVQQFLQASIVDANGIAVPAGSPGFLRLQSLNANHHIVIDNLDSKEVGLPASVAPVVQAVAATNTNFAQYFELNDFFVANPVKMLGTTSSSLFNSAINMAVRSDIVANPNLISLGQLAQSPTTPTSTPVGIKAATASFKLSGNPSVNDTITMNGVTFTYVAAAAGNNQITIGATLPLTLVNTINKLNALNATTAGTVDQATYSDNGIDTFNVTYTSLGLAGNAFPLAGNFATVGGSVNGAIANTTPSAHLTGGFNDFTTTDLQPWSYQLGIGSNQAVIQLSNLGKAIVSFPAAGGLAAFSSTFSAFTSDIVSYAAGKSLDAASDASRKISIQQTYITKFQAGSGVNLDQELSDAVRYQNAYGASARIFSVNRQLYDVLLDAFR